MIDFSEFPKGGATTGDTWHWNNAKCDQMVTDGVTELTMRRGESVTLIATAAGWRLRQSLTDAQLRALGFLSRQTAE
jgi:hypothetical protein